MRTTSPPTLAACLALAILAGCATTDPTPNPAPPVDEGCTALQAQLTEGTEALKGHFEAVDGLNPGFSALTARFAALKPDLIQAADTLCAPEIPDQTRRARQYCAQRRVSALSQLAAALDGRDETHGPEEAVWRAEGKLSWLTQTLRCESHAKAMPEAFEGLEKGPIDDHHTARGGQVDGGAFTLETGGAPFKSRAVTLTAALLCQRAQEDGTWKNVPDCTQATLTEGDRFKLAFSLSTNAHVYFYLFNGKGQFQMFFPGPDSDNLAVAQRQYMFPPGERWVRLDDVKNVREHVMLVASTYPVEELESLRGADLPPRPDGALHARAEGLRGRIEPLLTRDPTRKGELVIKNDGVDRTVIPAIVETRDIAVVEYAIRHK